MGPHTQSYIPFGNIDIKYKREYFSSYPDQVIMMRFECNKSELLHFTVSLSSSLKVFTTAEGSHLVLSGRAPKHVAPNYVSTDEPVVYGNGEGMSFEGRLSVKLEDGNAVLENGQLTVEGRQVLMVMIVHLLQTVVILLRLQKWIWMLSKKNHTRSYYKTI